MNVHQVVLITIIILLFVVGTFLSSVFVFTIRVTRYRFFSLVALMLSMCCATAIFLIV